MSNTHDSEGWADVDPADLQGDDLDDLEDQDLFDEDEDEVLDFDGSPLRFQDPGGNSALRAASGTNPRNLPCPKCGREDMLTPRDRSLGYICNPCADQAERGGF